MFRLVRAHALLLISTRAADDPCGATEPSGHHAAMKVLEKIKG